MTLVEKIIDLSRKGYSVRFQATETFPDAISITLYDTKEKWFYTIPMNCEYGIPPEEEIVGVLRELEVKLWEA